MILDNQQLFFNPSKFRLKIIILTWAVKCHIIQKGTCILNKTKFYNQRNILIPYLEQIYLTNINCVTA